MILPGKSDPNNTPATSPPTSPDAIAELRLAVMQLQDSLDALADRVLLLEAAAHHLADLVGLDLLSIPDPVARRTPP